MDILKGKFKSLVGKQNATSADLAEAKKLVAEMNGRIDEYVKEIERLQTENKQLFVDKENLTTAIERASLLSSRDGNNAIVKLSLRQDNIVEITSNSPEIGKVLEEVYPVDEIVGQPFKIAFSSKYILDALKIFNSAVPAPSIYS